MDKFVSNIMNMFMFYISCSLYLFCAAYMRHLPFISKARHTLLITTIHTSKKLLEFKHLFLPKCKLRTYWIATVFKENVANYILCEFQIVFRGGPQCCSCNPLCFSQYCVRYCELPVHSLHRVRHSTECTELQISDFRFGHSSACTEL